jgi:restriction system protein
LKRKIHSHVFAEWHGFVDPALRSECDNQIGRNVEMRNTVADRAHLSEEDMGEIMSSGEAHWANKCTGL